MLALLGGDWRFAEYERIWLLVIVTRDSLLFIYQQKLIAERERAPCFQAFMNNNYVGFVLFCRYFI